MLGAAGVAFSQTISGTSQIAIGSKLTRFRSGQRAESGR
jgi:hypothetical protein